MPKINVHEALIYLMVIVSASDREMKDVELARFGALIRIWPVFKGFDEDRLIPVAQTCQRLLQADDGLATVLQLVKTALPERLHDTAYAAAREIAEADLEMRPEENRLLQLIGQTLAITPETVKAISVTTRARHRMAV